VGKNFEVTDKMTPISKYSIVRAVAVAQIATIGFAAGFMLNSLHMSCVMSLRIGSLVVLLHTINSIFLLAAILFERKWGIIAIPLLSWFMVATLVKLSIH
jgi:hypothetical protein